MTAFVLGSTSCGVATSNGNTAPVVNAGTNYTIPFGTAFILKGAATDTNGDSLTYCWEQYNNEITTQPPLATATTGPNFRSIAPTTSPNRYFPVFSSVLSGNLTPTWEVVPNVARTMNFALTVRDNRAGGGMTNRGNMVVTFANVGPFRITSPSVENTSWAVGSTQTVTWDVAGTTANGINTANVNILISTDGGATFTTLVANTPNDGTQTITAPAAPTQNCRIMIEAIGNIFYAVSKNIGVGYTFTNVCNTYTNNTALPVPDGVGANLAGATVTKTISVPVTTSITDVNVTLSGAHTFYWDLVVALIHPDATQTRLLNRNCNQVSTGFNVLFNDASPAIVCAGNLTGTFAPAQALSVFNGKPANGTWTLAVNDNYNGDTGTINNWSVEICSVQATLSTENFGLTDFVVYPNPSNGNFNIQFTSNSSNGIKVLVHDMRGRIISESSFSNNATFNENIQLNNAQAGVYLLTVTDGERKEVKKIVVE
jgi:subtilisin-like proprotein convertase family protein